MGADVCECFTDQTVPVPVIAQTRMVQAARATDLYIMSGAPRPESGYHAYFTLWADDEDFDLAELCKELSHTFSPLCAIWKADHGGVGGYVIYQQGAVVESVSQDGEDYLLLPIHGVEQAFARRIALDEDDRVCFPELLFDAAVRCYRLQNQGQHITEMPSATVTALFENDLNVEPTFPFEQ
jgi:hypothetical protein